MGLREKNLERRRQRILAATRALIAREGADGWSMRKVAQAAEVSVPTLYNLFGSKDEIRSAMCAGAFDDQSGFHLVSEIFIDRKPPNYEFAGEHERMTEKEVYEKYGVTG